MADSKLIFVFSDGEHVWVHDHEMELVWYPKDGDREVEIPAVRQADVMLHMGIHMWRALFGFNPPLRSQTTYRIHAAGAREEAYPDNPPERKRGTWAQ